MIKHIGVPLLVLVVPQLMISERVRAGALTPNLSEQPSGISPNHLAHNPLRGAILSGNPPLENSQWSL